MSDHAELAPSSAERWLNCTASVAFTRGVIEEESEYALEGTLAHEKLELWNTLGVPPLDGETYYNLLPAHEMVLDLEKRGYQVEFEVRVRSSERLWGTVDILATKNKKALLLDEKYGYVPVKVEYNPQLLTYLKCLEDDRQIKYNDMTVGIHQPRLPHIDGEMRFFKVTRETMDFFDNEVHSAIRTIDEGETKFMAGKWCRYCPKFGNCRVGTNYFAKLLTGVNLL